VDKADGLFVSDEAMLRKKIQELQHYRRAGLTTAADIDKYEADSIKRVSQP
jgi:transcriptional adapter 2-alpha